jgi:hypothetical protein
MSETGQKAKYSRRAHVFRFGPNKGHAVGFIWLFAASRFVPGTDLKPSHFAESENLATAASA